jgi:hypothetical protein
LKNWQQKEPERFKKQVYNLSGLDSKPLKNQSAIKTHIIHAAAGTFALFDSSAIIVSVVLVFQSKHKKCPIYYDCSFIIFASIAAFSVIRVTADL